MEKFILINNNNLLPISGIKSIEIDNTSIIVLTNIRCGKYKLFAFEEKYINKEKAQIRFHELNKMLCV